MALQEKNFFHHRGLRVGTTRGALVARIGGIQGRMAVLSGVGVIVRVGVILGQAVVATVGTGVFVYPVIGVTVNLGGNVGVFSTFSVSTGVLVGVLVGTKVGTLGGVLLGYFVTAIDGEGFAGKVSLG